MSAAIAPRILRLPQVENLTGIKRTAIYGLEAEGDFPSRIKLTPKASGWVEAEVIEWIHRRIAAGRGESNNDKNATAFRCDRPLPPTICGSEINNLQSSAGPK